MAKIILLIVITFSLTSCVTEKELLSKTTNSAMILDSNLNGTYSYVNVGIEEKADLPNVFLSYKRIKFDDERNSSLDSLQTRIEYDGDKKLKITLLDSISVIQTFDLRVKDRGNYLSVKRKLFLIPIPFLFYFHKERKAIIFSDNNGDLHIIEGEEQSIWIFMAGGYSFTNHHKFEKKE